MKKTHTETMRDLLWQKVRRNVDRNNEIMQIRESATSGYKYGPAGVAVRHGPWVEGPSQYISAKAHVPGIRAALRLGKCAEAKKKIKILRKAITREARYSDAAESKAEIARLRRAATAMMKAAKTCKRKK